MKYISKTGEPTSFANWKRSNPTLGYDLLLGTPKQDLKDSLINEQKYLCCYCESVITTSNSHIEHFKPKGTGMFPNLQLDYNNLHVSCRRLRTGDQDEHCGHKKYDQFSTNLISPLEVDCATHFKYKLDGAIQGTDARGIETVVILNLDSTLLKQKRKQLIDYFIEDVEGAGLDIGAEMAIHLDTGGGTLNEFYTMIQYFSMANSI